MSRIDEHRAALRRLDGPWEPYLRERSGLPGPRANLELAAAAADLADAATLRRWAGDGDEYLAFCGVLGLGRLAAEGDAEVVAELRRHAGDPRWRVREAVAMALQRWGDDDLPAMTAIARDWAGGTPLEQRAAVAALCEPRLLRDPAQAATVLDVLAHITRALAALPAGERRRDGVRTLRQALGYAWSVAVVAAPEAGRPAFAALRDLGDRDVDWIVAENLRKKRLERMDAAWVAELRR